MPRAANGNYTLPVGNPVVTNTPVSSTVQNTTMSDVAAALSDSLSRSGLGGMLAPLPFIAGTVNSPGFTWSTELVSGFYLAGTNDMRATVAGVQRMRWTSVGCDIWDTTANAGAGGWLTLSSAAGNNIALLNVENKFTADQFVLGGKSFRAQNSDNLKYLALAHNSTNGYVDTSVGGGDFAIYTEGVIRAVFNPNGIAVQNSGSLLFNNTGISRAPTGKEGLIVRDLGGWHGSGLYWNDGTQTSGRVKVQTTTPTASDAAAAFDIVLVYE